MLTLERCREIIGANGAESDVELEVLRNRLYDLARITVEAALRRRRGSAPRNAPDAAQRAIDSAARAEVPSKQAGFFAAVAMLSDEDRYTVLERAGIHEFDGGLDRDTAERAAFSEHWRSKHGGN